MLIDAGLNSSISLQWKIKRLDEGTYVMENFYYEHSYAHCILNCDYVIARNRQATEWHIELESNGRYKYGEK